MVDFVFFFVIFQILTSVLMKFCTTARTSFISASTLAARTSVNVIKACTLLMENAEVMKITKLELDFVGKDVVAL